MATGSNEPIDARLFVAQRFGSFRVLDRASGKRLRFRTRKAAAVLAQLLSSDGRAVSRDRILGMLWGSRGEAQARASLRQALAELRTLPFSPALQIERQLVRLVHGTVLTETALIDDAVARGDWSEFARLVDALEPRTYEGLDGISPEFDEWLASDRARITAHAIESIVGGLVALTKDMAASLGRRIATAAQRLDPADERLVRLGMTFDQQDGDQAALHRRYRLFETSLARECDARPSSQTVALYRQLTTVSPVGDAEPIARGNAGAPPWPRLQEPPIVVIQPVVTEGDAQRIAARFCRAELEIALAGIAEIRLLSLDDPDPAALEAVIARSVASYTLRGWLGGGDDQLRLKWLLTRTRDGLLVWSQAFDVGRGEIGAAIAEVVAKVAGAVLPAVERDLVSTMPTSPCGTEATAYELYYEGRTLMLADGGLAQRQMAVTLFERAIVCDHRLVNAYLDLSRLFNTDFGQKMLGHDAAPMRARAFELCAQVVTIDPGSARGAARMGWCYLRRGDAAPTRRWFERALSLSQHHADCLNEVGCGFLLLGDLDRAAELLARAFDLNPYPLSDYFADTGMYLMLTGDFARAEEYFEIARASAMHYRIMRVANRALLDGRGVSEADAIRADLAGMWHGAPDPTDRSLFDAAKAFLPLQLPAHWEIVAGGMAKAGWNLCRPSDGIVDQPR